MILKQSAAYIRLFVMVASSDHVSPATQTVMGSVLPTVKLGKAGASGVTAAGTVAEINSTTVPGMYQITLTPTDTGTIGDLVFHCTGPNADPTDFVDQVQAQVVSDLLLSVNGRALIADNIIANQVSGFNFLMVDAVTGLSKPGLTITAQRSQNGHGFAPCANPVTEISNGYYNINLSAADLNGATTLRFTAAGASDRNVLLLTAP